MASFTKNGQVVLITLLVLTIATTIALSLISRTTTDTTITNQVAQSSLAFNAAEAGIEEALKSGIGTSGPTVIGTAGATYQVSVATIGGSTGVYAFPDKTLEGKTETLWLVNHNADGTPDVTLTYTNPSIDICWSKESVPAALAVTLLYKDSSDSTYRVAKAAFADPNYPHTPSDFFAAPTSLSGGCGDGVTDYKQTLLFSSMGTNINAGTDILIALRLRPVYSDANIVANSSVVLPPQGNLIESTGSTGDTNRKVVVYQLYRAPSTIFDSAVYSKGSFVQ